MDNHWTSPKRPTYSPAYWRTVGAVSASLAAEEAAADAGLARTRPYAVPRVSPSLYSSHRINRRIDLMRHKDRMAYEMAKSHLSPVTTSEALFSTILEPPKRTRPVIPARSYGVNLAPLTSRRVPSGYGYEYGHEDGDVIDYYYSARRPRVYIPGPNATVQPYITQRLLRRERRKGQPDTLKRLFKGPTQAPTWQSPAASSAGDMGTRRQVLVNYHTSAPHEEPQSRSERPRGRPKVDVHVDDADGPSAEETRVEFTVPKPRKPSPKQKQKEEVEEEEQQYTRPAPRRRISPEPQWPEEVSPEPPREPSPEPVKEPTPEPVKEPSPEPVKEKEPSPKPASPRPKRSALKQKPKHASQEKPPSPKPLEPEPVPEPEKAPPTPEVKQPEPEPEPVTQPEPEPVPVPEPEPVAEPEPEPEAPPAEPEPEVPSSEPEVPPSEPEPEPEVPSSQPSQLVTEQQESEEPEAIQEDPEPTVEEPLTPQPPQEEESHPEAFATVEPVEEEIVEAATLQKEEEEKAEDTVNDADNDDDVWAARKTRTSRMSPVAWPADEEDAAVQEMNSADAQEPTDTGVLILVDKAPEEDFAFEEPQTDTSSAKVAVNCQSLVEAARKRITEFAQLLAEHEKIVREISRSQQSSRSSGHQ